MIQSHNRMLQRQNRGICSVTRQRGNVLISGVFERDDSASEQGISKHNLIYRSCRKRTGQKRGALVSLKQDPSFIIIFILNTTKLQKSTVAVCKTLGMFQYLHQGHWLGVLYLQTQIEYLHLNWILCLHLLVFISALHWVPERREVDYTANWTGLDTKSRQLLNECRKQTENINLH